MTTHTTGYHFSLNNQAFTARTVPGSSRLRITTDNDDFVGAFEPKWLRRSDLQSGYWTSLGSQINTDLLLQIERVALLINRQRLIRNAKSGNQHAKRGLGQLRRLPTLPKNCTLHFPCEET